LIRLLLVDDHPVVLDGLEAALAAHEGMAVVARAGSATEARAAMQAQDFDVALVDIRLADGSGFALLSGIEAKTPPAIVLLTTFQSPQYMKKAVELGARGYLLKTAPTPDIVDAVRRVAAGGAVFWVERDEHQAPGGDIELTDRERQIVAAVLAGRTNKEIAHELRVSSKTVEWHLGRLYARLGLQSRTELAARAERDAWLESWPDIGP